MIVKQISDVSIAVTPEEPDDLLALRRVVRLGDTIVGDTTRVIKQERDYARPDKGERVRIRISISTQKISLDGMLGRLRIGGSILESNNETVPHGSHHSLNVEINDKIVISKSGKDSKGWHSTEKKILRRNIKNSSNTRFILVAIDTASCGIARLQGTHLEITPNTYSGIGGKRYKTSHKLDEFLERAKHALDVVFRDDDTVIIFGPGTTKNRFANFVGNPSKYHTQTVEGIDSGGEDGIHLFTRSQVMKDTISESKLAAASAIIDQIMLLASRKSQKYTMGFKETHTAVQAGAVHSLIFSDAVLSDGRANTEQAMVNLLNAAEASGSIVYSVDSTTDIGLRAASLGGVIAVLRYALST